MKFAIASVLNENASDNQLANAECADKHQIERLDIAVSLSIIHLKCQFGDADER